MDLIDRGSNYESYSESTLDLNDTATTSKVFPLAAWSLASVYRKSDTWGSATLQFQISEDGTNWVNLGDTFTGNGINTQRNMPGRYGRIKVSAAAGSASTFDLKITIKRYS